MSYRTKNNPGATFFISLQIITSIFISTFLFGNADTTNKSYLKTARKIFRKGMTEQYAFELLKRITSVGPRLTGSPEAEAAAKLTRQLMEDMDFDNVHLEPAEVPHWVRGEKEKGWITSGESGTLSVPIAAIESDRGGFLPLGFGVGNAQTIKKFEKWEYLSKR